ncbi:MAG: GNAT family N-acetyltransferase [Acidobacteriota bacterium]
MNVRTAEDADINSLADVWHDGWHEAHARIVPAELTELRTVDSFRERLRAAISSVRVVGPPGAPLGFCIVKGDELYQLFVSPPARGSGVAAALLADAERRFTDKGVGTAWLACAIGNDRAARFYEKCGWRRAGTMLNLAETSAGAFPLEVWRYEKALKTVEAVDRTAFRIALANLRFPATPDESIALACRAIDAAASKGARIICFPEGFVPGYRGAGKSVPPPDAAFLERAWAEVGDAAGRANLTVVLGTERLVGGALLLTAVVMNADGSIAGFQDKVQIDPSEESTYTPGSDRRVFHTDSVTFGVVICHEGWRYPETVRWAARHGAEIVFHPHFHEAEPGSYRPTAFGDPANTFHEKAALCRAAENTCYFATVNYASAGSPTTSAIVGPDGTVIVYQPYGQEGLLIGDVNLTAATRLLAGRLRT